MIESAKKIKWKRKLNRFERNMNRTADKNINLIQLGTATRENKLNDKYFNKNMRNFYENERKQIDYQVQKID